MPTAGRFIDGRFQSFPWAVPIPVDENQFGYARRCYDCGAWKKVRHFLHMPGHIYPLCEGCGSTRVTMQELGKIVNG